MGFTPAQVDEMGLWEFVACFEGYKTAHGGKKKGEAVDPDSVSDDELRALGIEGF